MKALLTRELWWRAPVWAWLIQGFVWILTLLAMRAVFGWWEGVLKFALYGLPLIVMGMYFYLHRTLRRTGAMPGGV